MKPLLAHVYESHRVTYPCYVQPKLNGIRALYQNGRFQSRDELPFPVGLLDHLSRPLLATFDPSVILDGELYVHGWPLQRINSAVTPVRQKPTEDTLLVEYHVFDVVDFGKSFEERFLCPNKVAGICELPNRVDLCLVVNERVANDRYTKWVAAGYEGMMYRLGDCPYTAPKQLRNGKMNYNATTTHTNFLSDKNNRCWHLLKRKDWQDDEFEAVRLIEGEGKHKGTLGAIECAIPSRTLDPTETGYTFSAGSGLTDAERAHYWANPHLVLGHQIKVKYLVLSQDGIPLNPTILAIL